MMTIEQFSVCGSGLLAAKPNRSRPEGRSHNDREVVAMI
jgi:hypothetical protein